MFAIAALLLVPTKPAHPQRTLGYTSPTWQSSDARNVFDAGFKGTVFAPTNQAFAELENLAPQLNVSLTNQTFANELAVRAASRGHL